MAEWQITHGKTEHKNSGLTETHPIE